MQAVFFSMPPPFGVLRGGFIHDLLEHLAEIVKVVEADHKGDFGDGSAGSLQVEGGFFDPFAVDEFGDRHAGIFLELP